MCRSDYNKELVSKYAKRTVSVSFASDKYFCVKGTRFSFRVTRCPQTGKPILTAALVYPDGTTRGAESLVLIIQGLSPCRDTPYGRDGSFTRRIHCLRLTTRLAIRNPNKRRRKYLQEQRRAAEAAEIY